jgi:hypothetical protein
MKQYLLILIWTQSDLTKFVGMLIHYKIKFVEYTENISTQSIKIKNYTFFFSKTLLACLDLFFLGFELQVQD